MPHFGGGTGGNEVCEAGPAPSASIHEEEFMADTKVKNVVLVGQGGAGKTMLAEAMLHLSGKTSRLGGHAGTKPTLDYDGE